MSNLGTEFGEVLLLSNYFSSLNLCFAGLVIHLGFSF